MTEILVYNRQDLFLIHLILSLDYEIFGNGSGDVRRDMIEPTRRCLDLCDKYQAKLSIMFEVGGYRAIKKAQEARLLQFDYSPSQQIEEQVRYAAKNGHDVQLHLHPWWVGAELENGNWRLNPHYRRISDLPNGLWTENDQLSITGVLSQGRKTLETIIKPVCPDYQCLVYRAAMFWGQPSKELIIGLKKAGLIADSSVVSGMYEKKPVPTDYRSAKSSMGYWWTSAEDISQAGIAGENIIEFPVYSWRRPYICNLKWTKLHTTLKRRAAEKNDIYGYGMKQARQSTESLATVMGRLFSSQPFKYDFCKLSAKDMIRWLKRAIKESRSAGIDDTPVVMLGHSKDFWNDRNLEEFLNYVKTECNNEVQFKTFTESIKIIVQKDNRIDKGAVNRILS